jgi:transcriptional regulator with XRE-family HTH domain
MTSFLFLVGSVLFDTLYTLYTKYQICQGVFTAIFRKDKMNLMTSFTKFLEKKYLEWQMKEGRKTLEEFADYLGVGRQILSHWLSDKRNPGMESVRQLADKLGLEVYDALELPRPDEDLFNISALWGELNDYERLAIRKQVEKLARNNELQESGKNNHKGTKPLPQ